jgi:hypothetical protein
MWTGLNWLRTRADGVYFREHEGVPSELKNFAIVEYQIQQ